MKAGIVASGYKVPSGGGGTVTFRAVGTLDSGPNDLVSVGKPAGTASGDLLLIHAHSDNNQTMACTGFTAVGVATYTGFGGATRRSHYLWKIAGGSEPANYTVAGGGASYNEAFCLAYTGATGIGALGSTSASFNSPALTVAANNSMEVITFTFDNSSNSAAAPAGWTRRLNGSPGVYGAWSAERAANAGTTTSSNFTGVGDITYGYGSISIILTP